MKTVALLALLMIETLSIVSAQKLSHELQAMIDAENSFARFSKEKNMRDAFLANLTDSTILYTKDGPVKGKQLWLDRKPNENLLFWWPLFVGISAGNDMGFSTGPWQWSETKDSQPVAHGYFVSVWKKYGSKWKLATDIGSPMPGVDVSAASLHSSNPERNAGKGKNFKGVLIDLDGQYNDNCRTKGANHLSERFSKDAMLKYPHAFPDYFPFESTSNIAKPDFKTLRGEVSDSNDLGYTYGRVTALIVENNSLTPYNANFLRVWKYEDNSWKIVIEVISGAQ